VPEPVLFTRSSNWPWLLLSYGVSWPDLFRLVARQIVQILKGVKPADLPVQQATKFEMVVNLKTEKALGLTIPQSVLVRADEIIH
jgi:putative tryptophan/tyrosine transport system substrate-binding protein